MRVPEGFAISLATGASIMSLAERYGCNRKTVYAWASLPKVKEEVEQIRSDAIADAVRRIESYRGTAVDTVVEVMLTRGPYVCRCGAACVCQACGDEIQIPATPAKDRLKAAEIVLDRAGMPQRKVVEHTGSIEATGVLTPTEEQEILTAAADVLSARGLEDVATLVRSALQNATVINVESEDIPVETGEEKP